MRSPLLLTAFAAALAIVPATAGAATVTTDGNGTYTYLAGPGEVNNMSLQGAEDGSSVSFRTFNAAITSAPAGCVISADQFDATCANPKAVSMDLGDGDDSFAKSTPPTLPITVHGGAGADWLKGYVGDDVLYGDAGNDRLEAWKGNDTLDGGEGDDELDGALGADHLQGGPGNDLLHPDDYNEPSTDVVDGGDGIDTIDGDYADMDLEVQQPLFFTMAGGADDGRPGENDDLRSIERLKLSVSPTKYVGSEGADFVKVAQSTNAGTLIGNGGDDDLSGADGMETVDGGTGNDRLVGGFNDDVITGGPGRDQIIGDLPTGDCGPIWCKYPFGNDTINAQDGEIDTISCGWGTDTVNADANDVVDGDCETVKRAGAAPVPTTPGKPLPGKGDKGGKGANGSGASAALAKKVTIAKALKSGFTIKVTGVKAKSTIKLAATRKGKTVAKGSAKATTNGTATIKLRFTKKAKRSLRHAKAITLKVTGTGVSTTITLKRR